MMHETHMLPAHGSMNIDFIDTSDSLDKTTLTQMQRNTKIQGQGSSLFNIEAVMTSSSGIARILIVDDHEIVRDAVSLLLNKLERPVIALAAGDVQTARNILSNETVDLVLLGISSPIGPSLNGVVYLRKLPACPPIAVFSTHTTRRFVSSAVAVGVSGFIPKSRSAADILHAVNLLLGGNKYMPTEDEMSQTASTSDIEASEQNYAEENLAAAYDLAPREAAVLKCVCQGMPNKRISTELNISPNTVRNYLSRIFKVMNVRNRTEAVARTQNILR